MPKIKKIRPPFKSNGGKYYLSSWIIENFPKNYQELHYIEPFVGAGSVVLNKDRSDEESINDIDLNAIEIFRCLRDEPGRFIGRLKRIKYCKNTFEKSKKKITSKSSDYMDKALGEFILRRMSYGGNKKSFCPDDTTWENVIYEELPIISERLEGVYIFHKTAEQVIKAFNNYETLCYCDPPELTEENEKEHAELVNQLIQFRGSVIFSGHHCALYKNKFKEWKCVKKKPKSGKKTQCLWVNY